MVRRRAVVGALAGAGASLAGCIISNCGDPFPGFGLDLTVESIEETETGWRTTVAATVDYLNIRDDEVGVDGLAIGAYDPSPSLLAETTVGSMRWGDVPEENREHDGCAPQGTIAERVELATAEPPHSIGPRVYSGETLAAFDDGDLDPVTAQSYAQQQGSGWPPDRPDAASYESVEVAELPWPPPEDVAIDRSPGLTGVGFRIGPHCAERRRDHQLFVDREGFRLHWDRAVPDGRTRPVLQEITRNGSTVEATIGLRSVDHVPARSCAHRSYTLFGDAEDGADRGTTDGGTIERVIVTHVESDGAVVERRTLSESN